MATYLVAILIIRLHRVFADLGHRTNANYTLQRQVCLVSSVNTIRGRCRPVKHVLATEGKQTRVRSLLSVRHERIVYQVACPAAGQVVLTEAGSDWISDTAENCTYVARDQSTISGRLSVSEDHNNHVRRLLNLHIMGRCVTRGVWISASCEIHEFRLMAASEANKPISCAA